MSKFQTILTVVSTQRGVSVQHIKSSRRGREIVDARFEVCWLARCITDMTFVQIGQHLGDRDHTSIVHACKCIDKTLEHDKTYADDLAELEVMVRLLVKDKKSILIVRKKPINALHVARNIAMNEATIEVTADEVRALADAVLQANGEAISTIIYPAPETHKHS